MDILEYFNRIDNNVYFFKDILENFSMLQLFSIKETNFVRALISYLLISKVMESYDDETSVYLLDSLSNHFNKKEEQQIKFNGIKYNNAIRGVKYYIINNHLLEIYVNKIIIIDERKEIIFSKTFSEQKLILYIFNKYIIISEEDKISIYSYKNSEYVVILEIESVEIQNYFYFQNFFVFIYDYDVFIINNLEPIQIKQYNMKCNDPILTTSIQSILKYVENNSNFL